MILKRLPAELDVSYLSGGFYCGCGAEDQTFVPLMYRLCCVILFAFVSRASSEFYH